MIRERKNIAKPEINRTDGVTFEDAWRIMTERRSPEVADPRLLPVSSLEEEGHSRRFRGMDTEDLNRECIRLHGEERLEFNYLKDDPRDALTQFIDSVGDEDYSGLEHHCHAVVNRLAMAETQARETQNDQLRKKKEAELPGLYEDKAFFREVMRRWSTEYTQLKTQHE